MRWGSGDEVDGDAPPRWWGPPATPGPAPDRGAAGTGRPAGHDGCGRGRQLAGRALAAVRRRRGRAEATALRLGTSAGHRAARPAPRSRGLAPWGPHRDPYRGTPSEQAPMGTPRWGAHAAHSPQRVAGCGRVPGVGTDRAGERRRHDRPGAGRPGPAASPRPPAVARARAEAWSIGASSLERSTLTAARGIPPGAVVAPANPPRRSAPALDPGPASALEAARAAHRAPRSWRRLPQDRGRAGCPWAAGPDRQAGPTGPDPGWPALAGGTHPRLGQSLPQAGSLHGAGNDGDRTLAQPCPRHRHRPASDPRGPGSVTAGMRAPADAHDVASAHPLSARGRSALPAGSRGCPR
jgi:hypothetical protein